MGQRLSEVLAFCTVLSFPCCNWPYCVMTQHKGFLTSFYKEWCNSVYITLFASAMTEYLTMQVFDCSFEKLDSTNFFAFLIFCSSKRILGRQYFIRLEQTETELYKTNLEQTLYDNITTLLDCHLDSIVPMHY